MSTKRGGYGKAPHIKADRGDGDAGTVLPELLCNSGRLVVANEDDIDDSYRNARHVTVQGSEIATTSTAAGTSQLQIRGVSNSQQR